MEAGFRNHMFWYQISSSKTGMPCHHLHPENIRLFEEIHRYQKKPLSYFRPKKDGSLKGIRIMPPPSLPSLDNTLTVDGKEHSRVFQDLLPREFHQIDRLGVPE